MIRKTKAKNKTVTEKIEELLHGGSAEENDSSDEDECTGPKVIDFDTTEYEIPDARSTEIRKRNVKLLSEQSSRYAGKVSSRQEEKFDDDDSSSVGADSDSDNECSSDEGNMYEGDDDDDDLDGSEEEEHSNYNNSDGDSDSDIKSDMETDDNNYVKVMPQTNHQAEIQKGICVQNQLHIWERFLELRIQLQKLLTKSNQLPEPTVLCKLIDENKSQDLQQETVANVSLLLKSMLELQRHLFGQFPEIKAATKSILKRPCPFSNNNTQTTKKMLQEHLDKQFTEFRPYRNSVLLKWDDRTKLLTAKGGAKKSLHQEEYDIIKKIDNTLLNKTALIERSQTLKTSTTKSSNDDGTENEMDDGKKRNVNVYDDSDFYHQQLRELIEYKTNSSSTLSEVTKQFVELQKLRQKIKKKVDTRASKGRKLRYAVHNKLINFMAPNDPSTWTEEAKDELFKSLFV